MSTFTVVSGPEALFQDHQVSDDKERNPFPDSRAECASAVTALEQAATQLPTEEDVPAAADSKCTASVAGRRHTYYADTSSFGYRVFGDGWETFVVIDPRDCYVVR